MVSLGSIFGRRSHQLKIYAPITGKLIDHADIPDDGFADCMLGPTSAIIPYSGVIRSPFDGTITQTFKGGHVVALTAENGLQLLVHIGIGTVNLRGEGFKILMGSGSKVKRGDPIVEFDRKLIKSLGYQDIVVMVLCNPAHFKLISMHKPGIIDYGEELFTVKMIE